MSTQTKPSIVFVQGIWADGSCISKVIPTLQAEGYEVMASQHSLDTLEGDVATVTRTLGRVSAPAILVGHSYGGTLITAAGTDDRVAGLVYIAALAPDEGETSQSQQNQFPVTDVFSHIEIAAGRVWMLPKGVETFAGDLSEQEQKVVWATHVAPAADLFNRAGQKASAAGVRFAYHNHAFEFARLDGRKPYDVLLERCEPRYVAFEMDLYWITQGGQDPLAYFARWPGRFPMVHVKDSTGPPDHRMVDVGAGSIPWKAVFARREQAGIRHYFIEHDAPPDPLASVRRSYEYLRRLEV